MAHMQRATCRNLGGFLFFVDLFIQNVNRASKSRTVFIVGFLASRFSKLDPMLIGFDELFFSRKNRTKKPGEKTEPGARFFSFPKEARPCLSRNHNCASRGSKTVTLVEGKKTENAFFSVSERHGRDSRESTTVPLAEAKPCLSLKKKKTENAIFRFQEARP